MTIGEIVALTGLRTRAGTDLSCRIANIAPPDRAEAGDLTFMESGKFLDALKSTRATACLMGEKFEADIPAGLIVLSSSQPQTDFTTVGRKMYANALRPVSLFGITGVAPTAVVHPSAKIDKTATVDPGAAAEPPRQYERAPLLSVGFVGHILRADDPLALVLQNDNLTVLHANTNESSGENLR